MKMKTLYRIMIVALAIGAAALIGCSDSSSSSHNDPDTGNHVKGWLDVHGLDAKKAPSSNNGFAACQVCHGGDFGGGSADVSCFGCHEIIAPHPQSAIWNANHQSTDQRNAPVCDQCHHHDNPAPAPEGTDVGCFNATLCHVHPMNWAERDLHGAAAKAKPDGSTFAGFAACQVCHGDGFDGGIAGVSCFDCHVDRPHSNLDTWGDEPFRHITTNSANAPVCELCHRDVSGAGLPLSVPPGCFNDTLCHGVNNPHDPGWVDLTPGADEPHGEAAKLGPVNGEIQGFLMCQSCHGDDFTGGISGQDCFECHTETPHADAPWRGSPYTHTNTNRTNAAVCGECHDRDPNFNNHPAPAGREFDCFNNTLCHGHKD